MSSSSNLFRTTTAGDSNSNKQYQQSHHSMPAHKTLPIKKRHSKIRGTTTASPYGEDAAYYNTMHAAAAQNNYHTRHPGCVLQQQQQQQLPQSQYCCQSRHYDIWQNASSTYAFYPPYQSSNEEAMRSVGAQCAFGMNKPSHEVSQQQKTKQKKRVTFALESNTVNVREEETSEDFQNSWYQDQDYRNFEDENRRIVQSVRLNGGDFSHLDETQYSVHGLEQYIFPDGSSSIRSSTARRSRTMQHAAIVLDVYNFQKSNGLLLDDELVRKVSLRFSQEMIRTAFVRAAAPLRL
jgi:hypothetical protein